MDEAELLAWAASYAARFRAGLADRPVYPAAGLADLRSALAIPLPDNPVDPALVVEALAAGAEPGLVATGSPRYFGFVIGGALPAALAADWLTSTWDQNAGLYVGGPSASVVEEVAGRWLLDLLGLPADASYAYVTGGQMANFTGLAAARQHVLAASGWDVSSRGLAGAPAIRVIAGEHRHATIDRALRFLGIGTDAIVAVPADDGGRMTVDGTERAVAEALAAGPAPVIVCTQVGEVNTGAIDPIGPICDVAGSKGAWVHVDGAFGLWAAASPRLRPLVAGLERADSWATDAHKWLNVPYDCGLAFCAHPASHRAAMGVHAAYLEQAGDDGPRDQVDWTPEFSRRARAFTVYAALHSLGRSGVADLVDRCCDCARYFAEALGAHQSITVLNDVNLDQVLVRFAGEGGDDGALTRRVITEVQAGGECYMTGTVWQGAPAMRISIVNWQTTKADVDRSVAAIVRAVEVVGGTSRRAG